MRKLPYDPKQHVTFKELAEMFQVATSTAHDWLGKAKLRPLGEQEGVARKAPSLFDRDEAIAIMEDRKSGARQTGPRVPPNGDKPEGSAREELEDALSIIAQQSKRVKRLINSLESEMREEAIASLAEGLLERVRR